MSRPIVKGSTDQSTTVRILNTAGSPVTDVTAATSGLALFYRRGGAPRIPFASIVDLASPGAAHTDGGIVHIGDGYYRIDPPDLAFATGSAADVLVGGTATGHVIIGANHQLVAADPGDGAETIINFMRGPKRVVQVSGQWKFRVWAVGDDPDTDPVFYEANIDDPALPSEEDPQ